MKCQLKLVEPWIHASTHNIVMTVEWDFTSINGVAHTLGADSGEAAAEWARGADQPNQVHRGGRRHVKNHSWASTETGTSSARQINCYAGYLPLLFWVVWLLLHMKDTLLICKEKRTEGKTVSNANVSYLCQDIFSFFCSVRTHQWYMGFCCNVTVDFVSE